MSMSNKLINESLINNKKYTSKKTMINIFEYKKDNNILKNKNDLPSIKLKNQSNNCNIKKRNLFIKKLVFNPITYDKKQKMKKPLISPFSFSPLSKIKNYSSGELKPLSKRKLKPLNLKRSSLEDKIERYSSSRNLSQNLRQFSTNISSDNVKVNKSENNIDNNNKSINKGIKFKKLNLKLIDFLTKYRFRGHKDITLKNKYKFKFNNKHIQEFKKSILDLYNKKDNIKRKYLNNANFIHSFLFNIDRTINPHQDSLSAPSKKPNINISNKIIINVIKPKYEYVDYFGKENKIITRLTSNLTKFNTYDKYEEDINNLKLNKQLRVPKLMALKDSEEYKNKNYIKILEKKKKKEKMIEKEIIEQNKNMNKAIEISKKGYDKLKDKKMKNFSGLIKNTIQEHENVIKELDNIIEGDKKQYVNDFNGINVNFNKLEAQ